MSEKTANPDKLGTLGTLDIVALVQNNPLTKLSSDYDYGSKIIGKIQSVFTTEEQQMFVANFYCYFNYNSKKDFIILLDHIWRWLGYGRIEECKRCLIRHFTEGIDYKIEKISKIDKIYFPQIGGEKTKPSEEHHETRGRQPEYITLTINCFKKLCLKSKTDKADQIHDYYIQLEEILNEVVAEQSKELQQKLIFKDKELQEKLQLKDEEIKNTLIVNFHDKQVVYLIQVEESIIKFGYTNDIKRRYDEHLNQFGKDIKLLSVFETIYNREYEQMIKLELKKHIIEKEYKTNQTELIKLTCKFTMQDLNIKMEYLKNNIKGDLIAKLCKRISELEHKEELEKKDQEHTEVIEEHVEVIKEKTQVIGKLKTQNTVLLKQIKETPFRARNIVTGEIKSFKSFSDAGKISGIGPHSIVDNYLDKPKQHNGYVYYSDSNPYWEPPENFIFDDSIKPSTHMVMCKSVNKETNEITYYNSMKEAARHIGLEDSDSLFRKFVWLCTENANGKNTTHDVLSKYKWYKVESCGSWVFPDGTKQQIEENIIIKEPVKSTTVPRKKTTESFIEEAIEKHGERYDYSKVEYVGGRIKVKIICNIHGEFEQTPERHLRSKGCAKCKT